MNKNEFKAGKLSIHTKNIFPIIKKWLYSNHDIFLRELVSNAVDAMNKRKAIQPENKDNDFFIQINVNKKNKTIQVIDYGIGMTAEEVKKYINQIAFSGAEDFVKKFEDKKSSMIGQFGLGFYSTFMVADKVTIDSLSYKKDAKPTYWECQGETNYKMGGGKRKNVGTTVTVYLNEDNKEYLDEFKIRTLIEKYCNFTPFPIYLNKDKNAINLKEPLWLKNPQKIKDKEYKEFYKKLFHQFEDPLFWIHLNVDFPFKLKGILYFPKITNQIELNKGKIKLYCHNVFVADDLKEITPEFLLLLRGGMDIPDIPLNVSRSFLQEDKQVKTLSGYIVKKVADSLKNILKEDRKRYEKLWKDINHFVKYGFIENDKFYDNIKDHIIYKTSSGDYVTIGEYLKRNKTDSNMKKIYYAASEDTQVTYMNLMKREGIEVIMESSILDGHLFQKWEMRNPDIKFVRIDSEINEKLINKDKKELYDKNNKTQSDRIKDIFEKSLDNKNITVETQSFKLESIPAMIVFDEQVRRFQEISYLMNQDKNNLLSNHKIVVNVENKTVKKLLKLQEQKKTKEVNLLCNYIHELALLEQKQFNGKELKSFIDKSNKVLELV